ncbi:MAG: DUF1501 domain-containing protein [Planctomycetaceae bacterium]|nr:MAG: DUF1501 domain-containing protein [Planctomycetaceae bacterium]
MSRPEINPAARRDFMASIARSLLGVSFVGGLTRATGLGQLAAQETAPAAAPAAAKQIIYLFMDGAMSHLDTFDPKPGTEEGGETTAIATSVPGIQFGDRLPKLASIAGALAVVRSLGTETGAHDPAKYLMRTGYKQLNSVRHPGMGAWMAHQTKRLNADLPPNFLIGSGNRHPGAGFLDANLSPVPIGKATGGLANTKLPSYLDEKWFEKRLILANRFDQKFQSARQNPQVDAYNRLYSEAKQLLGSSKLDAFDLSQETDKVREAYGQNEFGQGCLLARRLVEQGIRFIEVNYGGWDMHQEIYEKLDTHAEVMDTAVSSLLRDLNARGLLKQTLVVVATEFGRTPKINVNAGRDHHPGVFSGLLAGAGIRAGQVYGASDDRGFSVDADRVTVEDFNATIAAAAGLDTKFDFYSPSGRPFRIGGGGDPVKELLA